MSEEVVEELEVRQKGLNYCKVYLSGPWKNATLNDFEMIHVKGGLTNLLYRCRLKNFSSSGDHPYSSIPTCVILRLYGKILSDHRDTVLIDSVIFTLLAERKMGPQLYGVFSEGRLEEFLLSKPLDTAQLGVPKIMRSCARVMAQFHSLQMPMVKEPRWLFDTISNHLKTLKNLYEAQDHSLKHDDIKKMKLLLSYDLNAEFESLRNLTNDVDSLVVFCHNDFQEGNILLLEDASRNGFQHSELVQPIDFEYASYNYRGFDIGNHFCEWCYDYKVTDSKGYVYNLANYPSKEQQIEFAKTYLSTWSLHPVQRSLQKELAIEKGSAITITEIEKLLLEANTYALASHFLWGLWSGVQAHISKIKFSYLDYSLDRFDAYFKQKHFIESAILNSKKPT